MTEKLWPLRPKPKELELLSYWIRRIAEEYEADYLCFCRSALHINHRQMKTLDLDPPAEAVTILAEGIGIPAEDIMNMTIPTVFNKLKRIHERESRRDPWGSKETRIRMVEDLYAVASYKSSILKRRRRSRENMKDAVERRPHSRDNARGSAWKWEYIDD
jgi:hypothetical protein